MVYTAEEIESSVMHAGSEPSFLEAFIRLHSEVERARTGESIVSDGETLSIASVVAAGRYAASVDLDESMTARKRVEASQQVVEQKLAAGQSVYGLSTGFGGSADTRTSQSLVLGKSLLQHQHAGVIPSPRSPSSPLPLLDLTSNIMPESWVRGAILIRINSLIRGHSGVRWKFIDALRLLLVKNITPVVPLRGSISASGDLSPLSYVAGALIGNPSIKCYSTSLESGVRRVISCVEAFKEHGLEHVEFEAKEHLGLLNGTAFSASVASLAMQETVNLTMISLVATAMGTEALLGTQASHSPFIHAIARPHPGQIEAAATIFSLLSGSALAQTGEERELKIEEDTGKLRQDRYALRTSPQWLGPQLEDIVSAIRQLEREINSTTDNPLVDATTGHIHHGGNFQAMAVTTAMERVRQAIQHIGKLMFAQMTELLNPVSNRGLPPNLASTDPSVNYFAKGLDIAAAAYVSELGWLANPVATHVQSAEMHNQAVNSLALISGRATQQAVDVLTMLLSSYLYTLCQALDLRTLQHEFDQGLQTILREEVENHFPSSSSLQTLPALLLFTMREALEISTTQDAGPRLAVAAEVLSAPLLKFFFTLPEEESSALIRKIPAFILDLSKRGADLLQSLRRSYLDGSRGPMPAIAFLAYGTRPMYEFIRGTLGVRMHGWENLNSFDLHAMGVPAEVEAQSKSTLGFDEREGSIGMNVSKIYDSIRDGRMQTVLAGLFGRA